MSLLLLLSCATPECARPQYQRPECRVQAENEFARLVTADGVDVRFHDPLGSEAPWDAAGLVHSMDGGARARVGGLGGFRITLTTTEPLTFSLRVDNVHPLIEPLQGEVERDGLSRHVVLDLGPGETEVVGVLPTAVCETGIRVAAGGDIQTNPAHFRRIVTDLHDEAAHADADGTPLMGLIILGDVSELTLEDELSEVLDILSASPVPAAIVPGNHDVYDSKDAVFNRTIGPGNMAFTVCGARFVLLDSGSGFLADTIMGTLPQLIGSDWTTLVAGMHHPPHPGQTSAGWTDEPQAQMLLAELASHDADLVLAGHVHQRLAIEEAPVPEIIVGSLGADQYAVDPDYGYLRMTLTDTVDSCFVSVTTPGSPGVDRGPPDNCPPR